MIKKKVHMKIVLYLDVMIKRVCRMM